MIAVLAETGRLTTPGPAGGGRAAVRRDRRHRPGRADRDAAAARRAPGGRRRRRLGDRQPQPGLAQLTELIDGARDASGAGTRLIVSGPVTPLDPGVELAAYRIVQEALTNARRHAPGAAVDVELRYSAERAAAAGQGQRPGPGSAAARGPRRTGRRARAARDAGAGRLRRRVAADRRPAARRRVPRSRPCCRAAAGAAVSPRRHDRQASR